MKKKFFIITTVPDSFIFFKGQIQILKQHFDVEMVSSPGKMFEDFCKSEIVIGNKINMRREISILHDIRSLIKILILLHKKKPSYIHGSTPKAGFLSMLAGWLLNIPHRIYYIHGIRYFGESGLKKNILIFIEKLSCYMASDIFVVSHGVKKTLIDDKITKKELNIIHNGSINGVDCDYFSPENNQIDCIKKDYSLTGNEYVFGFIGRIVSDKGINELVASFIKINEIYPDTKLFLVGPYEKSLDPLLPNTISRIIDHPDIIKIDYQNDVRPFYKLFDVFVFPSYREGFGISLIEALAMKIPVIASDIPGCNEIISHQSNGILVKSKSINELFLSMISSIKNVSIFQKYANQGRASVIEKYSHDVVSKQTLKAYSKLK